MLCRIGDSRVEEGDLEWMESQWSVKLEVGELGEYCSLE